MCSRTCFASLLVIAATVLLPGPSSAREACPGVASDVMVTAASSPIESKLVCAGALQALELLGLCGITPRGMIGIGIQREVRHPLAGLIFGYYDLKERHIVLTSFDGLPTLMLDTPYADVPPDDFYKSLVVHEVVHSVMHQNLKSEVRSQAAYEYPAYALQIASLPAPVRSTFLKTFDPERIESAPPLSDTILAFAPYLFAARAYTHFADASSGCANIRAVMTTGDDKFEDVRQAGFGTD